MNRALLIACFAISTLALALTLVPRELPAASPPSASGNGPTLDDLELLERRIDAVEDLNRDLLNRVAQLQRLSPALALGADAGVPQALQLEVAQLRDEVHGMIAGEALHSPGGKTWLKDTLRELQAEDQRARVEQRLAGASERSEEQKAQWKKFVGDAHLNYAQEQALTKALDAESTRRDALVAEARAGTKDPRDVFRATRDLQRDTDKTVKAQLDETQTKQYEQLRREQRGGGWGGDRGGGRPERGPTQQ